MTVFNYKYAAIMSNGVIFASNDLRVVYRRAESDRRHAITREDAGQRGYTLTKDEKPFYCIKDGKDVTLREAEVSVRLYNTMIRHVLRQGLAPEDTEDLTMGQLKSFARNGLLHNVRTAGIKTYVELFENIWYYTGWDGITQQAFDGIMRDLPNGNKWVGKYPTLAR